MTLLRRCFSTLCAVVCLALCLVIPLEARNKAVSKNRLVTLVSDNSVKAGKPTLVVPIQGVHGEVRSAARHAGFSNSYNFLALLSQRIRFDTFASADTSKNFHRLEVLAASGQDLATVRLTLGEGQPVEITAFNILGKRVADIYNGETRTGVNMVSFDLSQLSSGMYICVVRGQRFKVAEKFIVSR